LIAKPNAVAIIGGRHRWHFGGCLSEAGRLIDEAPGRRSLVLAFGHGHTGMTSGGRPAA
jgi:hypothetical protein